MAFKVFEEKFSDNLIGDQKKKKSLYVMSHFSLAVFQIVFLNFD